MSPKMKIMRIMASRTLVRAIDSPSKIMLKKMVKMMPMNCPPKSRMPPAVASPTGNDVCVAKSVAVVSKG